MLPQISIIVAHSRNMAIGKANALLWRLPEDLKRFKKLTTGHPIIMGRKTYQSINRPLPDRTNIIVTRDENLEIPGCIIVHSVTGAIEKAKEFDREEIFIIGGAEIYKEILSLVDRLYVTKVDLDVEGDAFFPEYSNIFTKKISEESGEFKGLKYSYLILEK
ncbi:MAG: Dihydrofolate reductase [Parcubacteria group bacterium GW2011_GWC1_43_30]|nr:MAG: Dihydrofolate reductase [Parcubacteria group bacterium GW2011_GWC1_43_30]